MSLEETGLTTTAGMSCHRSSRCPAMAEHPRQQMKHWAASMRGQRQLYEKPKELT